VLPAVGPSGGAVAAALFPLWAANRATGGRIQRRRSGSGGKERGGRPVLRAVGTSGGAAAAALFPLCARPVLPAVGSSGGRIQRRCSGGGGNERGGRPVLPAVGSSGGAVAVAPFPLWAATCTTGVRIQQQRRGGEATQGPFCVVGDPSSGCLWRRQTAAPNARALWYCKRVN
jgi:hypothetical protein